MSNLGYGTTYDAVREIGRYWKAALPADRFSLIFDKGEPERAEPLPGKPWVAIRYTGPQEDGGGLAKAKVPRYLSFAVRFYHAPEPFPGDGGDPYLASQDLCLRGESDFEAMVAEHPRLGAQVLDSVVLEGVTGDMEDAFGGQWYGHELLITVQVH